MAAERRRGLVGQDRPSRIPVLAVDDLPGIPLLRADRAVGIDQVGEQWPGPVAAVEARLVEIGARAPRAGVERDRRGCRGLGLDVDRDRLKGGGERRAVLREVRGIGATQGGELIHRRDRAWIGHRVAHADDVGLDIVRKAADRDAAQRADLPENIVRGRRKSPRVRRRVVSILLLVQRIHVPPPIGGRVAVGRKHDEASLARQADRRRAAGEVLISGQHAARQWREHGRVLDLRAIRRFGRKHRLDVGQMAGGARRHDRLVDHALSVDAGVEAPRAVGIQLPGNGRVERKVPGVGRGKAEAGPEIGHVRFERRPRIVVNQKQ